MTNKSKNKKKPEKIKFAKELFSVVKFVEPEAIGRNIKSFECIPDVWFVDEEKQMCFWPPNSKKSFILRAMNQDIPDDDWLVYECEVVSEGHGKSKNSRALRCFV